MKKTNKLLAFVIAFAMVLSVVVMPVSAGSINIAGKITGLNENGAPTYTGLVKASADATNPYYAKKNTCTLSFEDGVISVSGRNAAATAGIEIKKLGVQSGKTYYLSAEFRRDSDPYIAGSPATVGNLKARMYFHTEGTEVAGTKAAAPSSDLGEKELTEKGEWYTVSKVQTIGVNESGTKELGLHFGFKVGQNTNAETFDYSIRNIVVYEIEDTLTATVAPGTAANTAVFTFSNPVDASSVAAGDFKVVTPSGALNMSGVSSFAVDGNTVTVTVLGGAGYGYTVTAKSGAIKDIAGKSLSADVEGTITCNWDGYTLADGVVSAGDEVLGCYGADGTFESGTVGEAMTGGVSYHPYVDSPERAIGWPTKANGPVTDAAAHGGTKSLAIADATGNNGNFTYIPLDAGAVYAATAYVRLQNAPAEGSGDVKAFFGSYAAGANSINVNLTTSNATLSTEWAKVTATITTTAKTAQDRYSHAHLYIKTSSAAPIYVDDLTLVKIPALTATAATAATGAAFTFNNALGTVTPANFTVSPQAAVATSTSGNVVTVTLSDTKPGTTYTIKTNGIKDAYGQTLAAEVSATYTTGGGVPVGEELAPSKKFNYVRYEGVSVDNTTDGVTTVDIPDGGISKDAIIVQMTGAFNAYADTVYVASAWVKSTGTSDGASKVTMPFSYSGDAKKVLDHNAAPARYNTVTLNSTDWQRVYTIVSPKALANTDANYDASKIDAAKMHLDLFAKGADDFQIKGIQIRELVDLDLDSASYKAVAFVDEYSGNASIFVSGGTDAIQFIAVADDGDIKFGTATAAEQDNAAIIDLGLAAGKTYRLFIWDSNMKPLQTVFSTADLK